MTTLPIYAINLNRRPDRMAALEVQMRRLGLAFERVPAVDGSDPAIAARADGLARTGPLGLVSDKSLACSLSHALAWRTLLDSSAEAALILEDDAALSPRAPTFLDAFGMARLGLDLIKLERKSNERGVFVEKSGYELAGVELRRLHSLHAGAAAYIISRRGAQAALDRFQVIDVPIDHFLFNPAHHSAFAELKPYQAFPALARQSREIGGGKSDIATRDRRGNIVTGARRFKYHFNRTANEAGAFMAALAGACVGRLTLRRAEFAETAL